MGNGTIERLMKKANELGMICTINEDSIYRDENVIRQIFQSIISKKRLHVPNPFIYDNPSAVESWSILDQGKGKYSHGPKQREAFSKSGTGNHLEQNFNLEDFVPALIGPGPAGTELEVLKLFQGKYTPPYLDVMVFDYSIPMLELAMEKLHYGITENPSIDIILRPDIYPITAQEIPLRIDNIREEKYPDKKLLFSIFGLINSKTDRIGLENLIPALISEVSLKGDLILASEHILNLQNTDTIIELGKKYGPEVWLEDIYKIEEAAKKCTSYQPNVFLRDAAIIKTLIEEYNVSEWRDLAASCEEAKEFLKVKPDNLVLGFNPTTTSIEFATDGGDEERNVIYLSDKPFTKEVSDENHRKEGLVKELFYKDPDSMLAIEILRPIPHSIDSEIASKVNHDILDYIKEKYDIETKSEIITFTLTPEQFDDAFEHLKGKYRKNIESVLPPSEASWSLDEKKLVLLSYIKAKRDKTQLGILPYHMKKLGAHPHKDVITCYLGEDDRPPEYQHKESLKDLLKKIERSEIKYPLKAMIIDDEETINAVKQHVNSGEGCSKIKKYLEIDYFSSIEKAKGVLQENSKNNNGYSIVVAEAIKGGIDGLSLLKYIHDEVDEAIPVFMMTDLTMRDAAMTSVQKGAKDLWLKPFNDYDLLVKMTQHAYGYQMHKSAKEYQEAI